MSKDYGFIPVYFRSLPSLDRVQITKSRTISLPVLLPDEITRHNRQIRKVKHDLTQLLSQTSESFQSNLSSLIFDVEELSDNFDATSLLKIEIHLLEFPWSLGRGIHIAFVLLN
ncbi:MAG: hypothetical protein ACYDA4_15520 [Ignavibacteriaceae bacterium]